MTYMFSYIKRGGKEVPFIRLQSTIESEVSLPIGSHQTVRIESETDTVTHDFIVANDVKEETVGEYYYKWYFIESYVKTIDRTPELKKAEEQNAANIDYVCMMLDVELPNEEVTEEPMEGDAE